MNKISDRNEELHNCDFVKTVLMLMVVFYHSCLFWNGNWNKFQPPVFDVSILFQMLVSWMSSWHTYAFALVSGYIFYYLRHETVRYTNFIKFLQMKLKRLLIPAYFVGLIWVVPVCIYFWGNGFNSVLNFVLGIRVAQQLWFLFMLFDVFMIAYIVGGLYTTIGCVCF